MDKPRRFEDYQSVRILNYGNRIRRTHSNGTTRTTHPERNFEKYQNGKYFEYGDAVPGEVVKKFDNLDNTITELERLVKEKLPGFEPTGKWLVHKGYTYELEPLAPNMINLLKETHPDVENLRWFSKTLNMTPEFKEALENPDIKNTLTTIKELVGMVVTPQEILGLPGFSKKFKFGRWNDFSLDIIGNRASGQVISSDVYLSGAWGNGLITAPEFNECFAEIMYEGKQR